MQQIKQQATDYNSILNLSENGRTVCLGRTRSGKSTLMDHLMSRYLLLYPTAKLLLIDSKPRYKTQWMTSGFSSRNFYRKWGRGQFVPGSYRVDQEQSIELELRKVWGYGGRIAIAQTRPGHLADLRWLQEVARVFYQIGSDKEPRLVVVDELADFFEVQRMAGIFHQIARSGGEMNVGLMAGSQRPRFIPSTILTECDRLYLFQLDHQKDVSTTHELGVPKTVQPPAEEHSFFYWNKFEKFRPPSGQYYRLELGHA